MAVIAAVALATTGRATDDGSKPADTTKPVKVFILLGQGKNTLGFSKPERGFTFKDIILTPVE